MGYTAKKDSDNCQSRQHCNFVHRPKRKLIGVEIKVKSKSTKTTQSAENLKSFAFPPLSCQIDLVKRINLWVIAPACKMGNGLDVRRCSEKAMQRQAAPIQEEGDHQAESRSIIDVTTEERQPIETTSASKRGPLCSVRLKENRQIA